MASCAYCRNTRPLVDVVSTCPVHGELRRAQACAECIPNPRGGRHVHEVLTCPTPVVLVLAGTHVHDSHRCPAHVRGCSCPTLRDWLCNPYWEAGYCPDDIDLMPNDEGAYRPSKLRDNSELRDALHQAVIDSQEQEKKWGPRVQTETLLRLIASLETARADDAATQWDLDHPNGEISPEERQAMADYASESAEPTARIVDREGRECASGMPEWKARHLLAAWDREHPQNAPHAVQP